LRTLKKGDRTPLELGGEALIIGEFGSGGQGTVYKAVHDGREYALKWYFPGKLKNFRRFKENIRKNIYEGPPSPSFLWPKLLTQDLGGAFGYLMDIRPADFKDFSDILNGRDKAGRKVGFENFRAAIEFGLNIVNSFRALHRQGKSYQDLNDGNFFVNTGNGEVLICDNDNVAPDRENFGIGGKPGYMAPEVVRGEAVPDTVTDRHSLAVILFKIFIRHDPLMGKAYVGKVCLTEQTEKELYGDRPVFIFDPQDKSNEPVPGIHHNPLKLWPLYPSYIREAFVESFSGGLKAPEKRLTENAWQKILIRFRGELITCQCGNEMFIESLKPDQNGIFVCGQCRAPVSYPLRLDMNGYPVYLFPRNRLYRCHTEKDSDDYQTVTGEVVRNKNNPALWGLKNLSGGLWNAIRPDDQKESVGAGAVMQLAPELRLEGDRVIGTITRSGVAK